MEPWSLGGSKICPGRGGEPWSLGGGPCRYIVDPPSLAAVRPVNRDNSSTSPGVRGYTPGTLGVCAGPRGVNLATTRQPHRVHAGAGPRAPSGRTGRDALLPAPPSSTLASPLSAPARGLPPAYGRACRRSARSAGVRRGTLPHTRSVASWGGCAGAPVAPGRPSRLHMRGAGGWLQLFRQPNSGLCPTAYLGVTTGTPIRSDIRERPPPTSHRLPILDPRHGFTSCSPPPSVRQRAPSARTWSVP